MFHVVLPRPGKVWGGQGVQMGTLGGKPQVRPWLSMKLSVQVSVFILTLKPATPPVEGGEGHNPCV